MKSGKLALAVAGIIVGFLGVAIAQVVQNTISGNEIFNVSQGPGGQGSYLGINTVRNGRALTLASGSGAATATATGGTLYWVGAAPTTWAVTLPSPAFDGQIVELDTDTTLTTMVTVSAGAGQTLHTTYTSQTLTNITPVSWAYNAASAVWYRVR